MRDEAVTDALGEVGKRERGERGPGQRNSCVDWRLDGRKEHAAALVVEPGDERRRDRRLPQRQPRESVHDIREDLAHNRIARRSNRLDAEPPLAVTVDKLNKAGEPLRAVAPDRVKLRRRVTPGLVGLQDPQKAVALQIALRADRGVVRDYPRLERRVTDSGPPGERERRRLDRRSHHVVAVDHVVVQSSRAFHRVLPEDRVADEPIRASRAQEGFQLSASAVGIEVPPGDRREA